MDWVRNFFNVTETQFRKYFIHLSGGCSCHKLCTFNTGEYLLLDTIVTEPPADDQVFTDPGSDYQKRIQVHVRHIQARDVNGAAQRATIFGAYAIRVTGSVAVYIGMNDERTELDIRVSGSSQDYSAWFRNASVDDAINGDLSITGVTMSKANTNTVSLVYGPGIVSFDTCTVITHVSSCVDVQENLVLCLSPIAKAMQVIS